MNDNNQCVCDTNYYQTSTDTENGPTCTACPAGSTTLTTDVQNINGCGMYDIIVPIG